MQGLAGVMILLLAYAGWIKIRSLDVDDDGAPLAIRWEGFYHDMNLRDIGASLNACLEEQLFREDVLLRSAGWFSGWSCDKVDNPDVIYSLNYSPKKEERYFCQSDEGKVIGRHYPAGVQLKDLEFEETWSDEAMRKTSCRYLRDIFLSILDGQKILLHCDAGRDRTGTMTALLVALAAESANRLNETMLNAIECDYRKTDSLNPDKFGRMKQFLLQITSEQPVSDFIQQNCSLPDGLMPLVADKMLK